MKWFKHLTDMRHDPKVKRLNRKYGVAGYGLYTYIIECIASNLDSKNPLPDLEETSDDISYDLKMEPELVEEIILYCIDKELFTIDLISEKVICEKIYKFLDDTTRKNPDIVKMINDFKKLRVSPSKSEQLGKDRKGSGKVLTEEEKKKKKKRKEIKDIPDSPESGDEKKEEFYITKKRRKLKDKRLETFKIFWETFNWKFGKADAADSWLDIPELTNALFSDISKAAKIEAVNRQALIDKGSTPKYAQGWITSRRWEDEVKPQNTSPQTGNFSQSTKTHEDIAQRSIDEANTALKKKNSDKKETGNNLNNIGKSMDSILGNALKKANVKIEGN